MTRLFTLVLVTTMALILGFGAPAQAQQSCKNGQCAVTLQSPETLLQSGMVITQPAYTKQVTVTYPERNFVLTEVPTEVPTEAPKKAKRFKLNIFKKCGG